MNGKNTNDTKGRFHWYKCNNNDSILWPGIILVELVFFLPCVCTWFNLLRRSSAFWSFVKHKCLKGFTWKMSISLLYNSLFLLFLKILHFSKKFYIFFLKILLFSPSKFCHFSLNSAFLAPQHSIFFSQNSNFLSW